MTQQTLLLLPGDGIGPEVTEQVRRVAEALTPDLEIQEWIYGGASFDLHGTPLTDEAKSAALASNAVLMGAVGGPKWAASSAAGSRAADPAQGNGRLRKPASGLVL
jgi:3-isopropylmalate dehydrogenase